MRWKRVWEANWKELLFKDYQNRMCMCVLGDEVCRAKLRDASEAKEGERIFRGVGNCDDTEDNLYLVPNLICV